MKNTEWMEWLDRIEEDVHSVLGKIEGWNGLGRIEEDRVC